jgi:hypothetical protein
MLKPEIRKFPSTGKNNDHIYVCEKYFTVGSNGCVIFSFYFISFHKLIIIGKDQPYN